MCTGTEKVCVCICDIKRAARQTELDHTIMGLYKHKVLVQGHEMSHIYLKASYSKVREH